MTLAEFADWARNRLATVLGKFPDDVGSIRLTRLFALFRYWRKHPPTHELVAAAIGFEPPMSVEEQQQAGAMGLEDFFGHFKRTGGKVEGAAAMPGR